MRQVCILVVFTFMTSFAFAQATAEETIDNQGTEEEGFGNQETHIVKDINESDEEILKKLNVDDFTMGENVFITKEMREKMKKEAEKRKAFEAAFAAQEAEKKNPQPQKPEPQAQKVVQTKKKVRKPSSRSSNVETARVRQKVDEPKPEVKKSTSPPPVRGKAATRYPVQSTGKVYKYKKKRKSLKGISIGGGSKGGKKAKCYKF